MFFLIALWIPFNIEGVCFLSINNGRNESREKSGFGSKLNFKKAPRRARNKGKCNTNEVDNDAEARRRNGRIRTGYKLKKNAIEWK